MTDPSAALREAEARIGAALSDDVLNRALEKRAETYLGSLRLEASKALAPLLVQLEQRAEAAELSVGTLQDEVLRLDRKLEAAERLVAEPREPGRCATCRHFDCADNWPAGVCMLGVKVAHSLIMYPPQEHFGCSLHEPVPSPASEAK